MYFLSLHQFQKDEKGHDDLFLTLLRFEKSSEIRVGMSLQIGADVESLVVNADLFALDFPKAAADRIPAAFLSAKHFTEDLLQALQICTFEELIIVDGRLVAQHFFRKLLLPKIAHACLFAADGELFGEIFVHLILQKTAHQFFTGIALLLTCLLVLFAGQQHTALDVEKSCRHDKELAGDVQILAVHLADVFQILVCDLDNRNIINVYFIFFNQVHEEIQRTFEHRKLNGNCHNFFLCLF